VRLKGLDEVSRNWGAPGPRRKSRYERCERCGGLCEGSKLEGIRDTSAVSAVEASARGHSWQDFLAQTEARLVRN